MGLLAVALGHNLSNTSTLLAVVTVFAAFAALAILFNVLFQFLHRDPKEPPVVFHWIPFLGSTITYGIDPYKFFFRCRRKVRNDRHITLEIEFSYYT